VEVPRQGECRRGRSQARYFHEKLKGGGGDACAHALGRHFSRFGRWLTERGLRREEKLRGGGGSLDDVMNIAFVLRVSTGRKEHKDRFEQRGRELQTRSVPTAWEGNQRGREEENFQLSKKERSETHLRKPSFRGFVVSC